MIGWIDAQAGASGDMLLGALVDVGVPLAVLQHAVDQLALELTFVARPVTRAGITATKVNVLVAGAPAEQATDTARTWAEVRTLLERLDEPADALEVFSRLASVEAAIHGVSVDEVHFHEVGALDALADVVGVTAGFAHLGLTRLHCSSIALGSGTTRGAHGPLPVPPPAVLTLLEGLPVHAGPAPFEATTPTAAALLSTLVTHWGPLPSMAPARTGAGAGTRDPHELANLTRLVLGEPLSQDLLLEANVDDLDPRVWPSVLQHLLDVGASDAWLTPILMKKGRPAHTLSVLLTEGCLTAVRRVVFTETTTIGLRLSPVTKEALHREITTVEVRGQSIRLKNAWYDGDLVTAMPEWDDVVAAADALGLPAKDVLLEAQTSEKNAKAPAPPANGTPTTS